MKPTATNRPLPNATLSRPLDVRVYTSSVGKIRSSARFQAGRQVNTQNFEYDDRGRVARITDRSASGSIRGRYEMIYGAEGLLQALEITAGPSSSTIEVRYELGTPPLIVQTMPRFGDLFGLDGLLADPTRLPTVQFILRQ